MMPGLVTFHALVTFSSIFMNSGTTDTAGQNPRGDFISGQGGDADIDSVTVQNGTVRIVMMNGSEIIAKTRPLEGFLSPNLEVLSVDKKESEVVADKNDKAVIKDQSNGCDFEGELPDDPESRFTISACDSSDVLFTVISGVYNFEKNTYRFLESNGNRKRLKRETPGKSRIMETNETKMPAFGKNIPPTDGHVSQDILAMKNLDSETEDYWQFIHKNKTLEIKDARIMKIEKTKRDESVIKYLLMNSKEFEEWYNTFEKEADLESPDEYNIEKAVDETAKRIYNIKTVELCVITDPMVFKVVKKIYTMNDSDQIINRIFKFVREILVSAQAFLMHPSISTSGGFKIQLNGLRVLKEWGPMKKMGRRKKLTHVLHDLANYLKIVNNNWDEGQNYSYDGVLLITGDDSFKDGDGFAYIGNVCNVDCPVVSKLKFQDDVLNPNMGRLIAHELGHLLGAYHDDEMHDVDRMNCNPGKYIMTTVVNKSMQAWSPCSRLAIEKNYKKKMSESNCFYT